MIEHKNTHEALSHYFMANTALFLAKKNMRSRVIGVLLTIPFIVLAIFPELINFGGIGFRIIFAVIALVILGFTFFGGFYKFYHRASGGLITTLKNKTFHIDGENDMDDIIQAFNDNDFEALREVAATDSGSLKIEIEHDKLGKKCFLLLKNEYYGKVNYLSEIKTFEGDEYDAYYPVLKRL